MPSFDESVAEAQAAVQAAAVQAITGLATTVVDFPQPGIVFRDLAPVFADGSALGLVTDALVEPYLGRIDVVAGVEARGFVLAAAAAYAGRREGLATRAQHLLQPSV